jgi:hypothetical protein
MLRFLYYSGVSREIRLEAFHVDIGLINPLRKDLKVVFRCCRVWRLPTNRKEMQLRKRFESF